MNVKQIKQKEKNEGQSADKLFTESCLSGYHAATRLYERDLLDLTVYNVS